MPQIIWYDFGPIRTSGSIVSRQTLHSLTGTLKGPGSFVSLGSRLAFILTVTLIHSTMLASDPSGVVIMDRLAEESDEM